MGAAKGHKTYKPPACNASIYCGKIDSRRPVKSSAAAVKAAA
jgi:hypothetical protein